MDRIGHIKVAENVDWMIEQIVATGSLVLRTIGGERAGEKRAHRVLSSPCAPTTALVGELARATAPRCAGRRIVAAQDTTEVNFAHRSGRKKGLGPAGNGRDRGFFIHPVIAVDAVDEAVLGVVDAQIWTRPETPAGDRKKRPFAAKESSRWQKGCEAAARVLAEAAEVTVVGDRENDIFRVFVGRPANTHLLVRAMQNRLLAGGSLLYDCHAGAEPLAVDDIVVPAKRTGQKPRAAKVALFASRVEIARPSSEPARAGLPDAVPMTFVEAREIGAPEGVEPLHWRLLTSHAVEDAAAAREMVRLYRLRWRIEEVFRMLKRDGLRLEETQLAEAERHFRLAVLALEGAVRTIQLVDARDGSPRPATDVVDPGHFPALAAMSRRLEGRTARQKNPHPQGSLSWLSWITARLGGWNCYYRPPGPKTMRNGWNRLAAMLDGYALAKAESLVGIP